jgi:hypothetical protein
MKNTENKPIDPFAIKFMSKWNPKRAFPTLGFRLQDLWSRLNFEKFAMPIVTPEEPDAEITSPPPGETAVTDDQRKVFAACLKRTEYLTEPCVEIGSYRGQTTRFFADRTHRAIIAIDPFYEKNGFPNHRQEFLKNTAAFKNVSLLRMTSGVGASHIQRASFAFIDAGHDYANVRFDLSAYAPKIVSGGILACHDTDNIDFAGTRRAVFEFLKNSADFEIIYHVENLVTLKRR